MQRNILGLNAVAQDDCMKIHTVFVRYVYEI